MDARALIMCMFTPCSVTFGPDSCTSWCGMTSLSVNVNIVPGATLRRWVAANALLPTDQVWQPLAWWRMRTCTDGGGAPAEAARADTGAAPVAGGAGMRRIG